ncbi:AGL193Wp [Eremothecium gossypii ATCC 10895]|uniref:AGL193Wp n=1 Tax=Eremothecium gossypii (strain ATCC 10895 / CBS 109.51 / FGSC 9923 / NRRL Y-1056) TaxID=284811 RepID=Q750Y2_EREGS|nr:AGL193Wp [Eremothecium gossypii ATCC 10895]AAS54298.1 AGL193Wp [Eremothecium gossypii ATCC 10895]AEY98624.1 FAGL193Wp [Eremothecium gossypii FDAG1]
MMYSQEAVGCQQQVVDAVCTWDPSLKDEIEAVLEWMDPNDDHNNHQMRPPSLRIKNSIRLLRLGEQAPGTTVGLLRQCAVSQMRQHFFRHWERLEQYTDMVKLERYYEFPLRYVAVFTEDEVAAELVGLRKYLLNGNPGFRANMEARIRALILQDDDFETAARLYKWIVQGLGHPMVKFVIEVLTQKIALFCRNRMDGNVDQRYLIMEVFNSFIARCWAQFIQLLQFPTADDPELNNLIYRCFEKKFIELKTQELFHQIIPKFPMSKPALLEMKSVIKGDTAELDRLVAQIYNDFHKELLVPSVTTVEILLYYVKTIKCLMVVDPTGRSMNRFTSKLKPKIKERSDLIISVLCAILELDSDEIHEVISKNTLTENPQLLSQLSKELKNSTALTFHSMSTSKGKAAIYSVAFERQDQLVKQFLEWTPEPGPFTADDAKALNSDDDGAETLELPKDVLEVVFQVFDSPEVLINEFIQLVTNHMLQMDGYVLNAKWSQLLKTVMKKYFKNNKQVLKSMCEESNLVNVFVMWSDLEKSATFQTWSTKLQLVPPNVYPKIISYLYWKIGRRSPYGDYAVAPGLAAIFDQMEKAFETRSPGRKLRFQKDQGSVDLQLVFEDGRHWSSRVSLPKYTVIDLFQRQACPLSVTDIAAHTNMSPRLVEDIIQFWCHEHVLHLNKNDLYEILENHNSAIASRQSQASVPAFHPVSSAYAT